MKIIKVDPSTNLKRYAFWLTWFCFCRWTPRSLNFLRIFVLRACGAKLGSKVIVYGSCKVWLPKNLNIKDGSCLGPNTLVYNVSQVIIGANTIISQNCEICTPSHQFDNPSFDLISGNITIGSNCWIASSCFVGPNSILSDGVILGAHAVTVGRKLDVGVYIGNPAKKVRDRQCIQYLF